MDIILLRTPGKPEHTLAVRLLVAGLAHLCRFNSEEIEDLKLAVSEACFCVPPDNGMLDLAFFLEEGRVTIEVKAPSLSTKRFLDLNDAAEEGIGLMLMRNLTDSMEFRSGDSGTFIRLVKAQKSSVPAAKAV